MKRGPNRGWTPEEDRFIRENYNRLMDWEIAEILGRKPGHIKSFRYNRNLVRDKALQLSRGRQVKRRLLNEEQHRYFLKYNSRWSCREMAEHLNRRFGLSVTEDQISGYRKNHSLPCGRDTRFHKGDVPWTKGKTIEEICKYDPEKIARASATRFTPESGRYLNLKPVGTITEHCDGYLWIKYKDDPTVEYPIYNWMLLHRFVWEHEKGPIPEGMQVIFKDGDRRNCRLENLVLMSNRERGYYRGMESADGDIQEMAVAVVRLKAAAKGRMEEMKDEE